MNARGLLVGCLLLLLAGRVNAQIPSAPAAPAAPAAAAPAGVQPTPTIWNKLGITKECCRECADKCCKSPLGQLLNNMTKPLTFATGGIIPPICPPTPSEDALKKILDPNSTASDAEKAAAAIKADEAGAAQRRAAIRYLGTVDCHYYPEAEDALISGLRGDRIECVRFEAALALQKGCCCTKKTMAALLIVVNGSDSDGQPAETSERVKAAAMDALQKCTCKASFRNEPTPPEKPGEVPPPEGPGGTAKALGGGVQLASFYTKQVPKTTNSQLVDQASRYLATTISTPADPRLPVTGQRSLVGVATISAPANPRANDQAFEEAVLTLTERKTPPATVVVEVTPQTGPTQPAAVPPTPSSTPAQAGPVRPEPIRPVRLTSPGPIYDPAR